MSSQSASGTPAVIVVGAGIVGVSTALRLRERGAAVTLVDPREPGEGASYGNAGVLAASSIVPVTTPGLLRKVPGMLLDRDGPLYLRWSYLPGMLPWLGRYLAHCRPERVRHIAARLAEITADSLAEHRALAAGTPAERHVRAMPYAYAYASEAAFAGDAFAWGLRREAGFAWSVLRDGAVREAEPALGPRYRLLVTLEDQHGTIDAPGDYVKALAAHFAASGGTVRRAEVRALAARDGVIEGVRLADGSALAAERVVLAAGAWSNRLLATVGLSVPLESERGYHVELHGSSVAPRRAIAVADGKFVADPMSGRLRLAGLVEFGGLDAGPSRAPLEMLLRRARSVFPGLEYEHHTEWMGHRPATSDSLPVIGESVRARGLFLAFGHHHVGLTGGPRTGRLVADLVVGARPNVDLAPFALERFH